METAILEIIDAINNGSEPLDDAWLDKLVRRRNRAAQDGSRRVAKKRLLPFYLRIKAEEPSRWAAWNVDEACEEQLVKLLKAKPRRTASGVATITVITKPWPCSSNCLYCPNDVRMPKSYLTDEPACQRAERNCFDPYLQVTSRLHALTDMGHVTDKIELIVLGGTWSDYPESYQTWFITELFRALNDAGEPRRAESGAEATDDTAGGIADAKTQAVASPLPSTPLSPRTSEAAAQAETRRAFYERCGIAWDRDELAAQTRKAQLAVNRGDTSYDQAVRELYRTPAWTQAEQTQKATLDDLFREHKRNESAAHRVVGLVIETRPDLITPESLTLMRQLGCTKVQMGIQSLDEDILRLNERNTTAAEIAQAFSWMRLFGFKIHVHFMVNLLGATPETDRRDYLRLVSDERFLPDEVKLYPCCLVESARLGERFAAGTWAPYPEDTLIGVLADDVLATPAYTRISRMIRDISATDIVAGSKKTNLRQMVETAVTRSGEPVREIRMREISTADVAPGDLSLECVTYRTTVSEERFLQWVTSDGRIAGFLRLSLPHTAAVENLKSRFGDSGASCPIEYGEAMIREVHVYGRVARLHHAGQGAQHTGLGKRLVAEACQQAKEAGYTAVNVISSVGTRGYYHDLGFTRCVLYQRKTLT